MNSTRRIIFFKFVIRRIKKGRIPGKWEFPNWVYIKHPVNTPIFRLIDNFIREKFGSSPLSLSLFALCLCFSVLGVNLTRFSLCFIAAAFRLLLCSYLLAILFSLRTLLLLLLFFFPSPSAPPRVHPLFSLPSSICLFLHWCWFDFLFLLFFFFCFSPNQQKQTQTRTTTRYDYDFQVCFCLLPLPLPFVTVSSAYRFLCPLRCSAAPRLPLFGLLFVWRQQRRRRRRFRHLRLAFFVRSMLLFLLWHVFVLLLLLSIL